MLIKLLKPYTTFSSYCSWAQHAAKSSLHNILYMQFSKFKTGNIITNVVKYCTNLFFNELFIEWEF